LLPIVGSISDDVVLTAFPNPFNEKVTLDYMIPASGLAKLAIYDINGRLVKTLFNASVQKGKYRMDWDGTDGRGNIVPSGVYHIRLLTEKSSEYRNVVFMQ